MNNRVSLTKIFSFETAHALKHYDGPCRNIHGHSYKLLITVSGLPIHDTSHVKDGMVMDFGDLKKIVKQYIVDPLDHSLMIRKDYKEVISNYQGKLHEFEFQPTCENLVLWMRDLLLMHLPKEVVLEKVKLYETETSYVSWKNAR